ncbi:hypothetical protein [uncultured Sphingomonas sp.]|uniref:hypothetical protein n=1 Tax=uncultured Sphingomonas sp. TaxID=158754 RepID=UPI0035CBD4C7
MTPSAMLRPLSAFLVPASLLLAACGGGSEGANTAAEESSAAPTVQQAVPENLTDDAGNKAIPLDPPPAATPAASATPAGLEAFPASFQGRWGLVAADCEPGRDDAKGLMEVGAKTLRFYESRATATALIQPRPARIEARLAFIGEGQEWTRANALTLIDDGTLIREERDPATSLRYARCPEPA